MRVLCMEIAADGDTNAVLSFHTHLNDGDKPQKGMAKIVMPLAQAREYVIGEEYELLPPHARPKVVKVAAGKKK